ncbi:MAG: NAD(P)/FAD-dependent oxidoreductase, partial [Peptococcaceae bacterium]|nr:NAD(P)/FAD-dependent oxidoreductase [Peptococcaceae bacterium]
SRVARWIGAAAGSERVRMYAAEVKLANPETDMVDIYLGRHLAPGWFGWVIPVDAKRARVGIGVSGKGKNPLAYFRRLVQAHPERFRNMEVLRLAGGVVPIGIRPKIYAPNVMLVGDAACHTKPISGGGIYLGLRGAGFCAEVALDALAGNDFSESSLSRYQANCQAAMENEIRGALLHRETFLRLADREMDRLIRFFNRPLWQAVIAKYGDIDHTLRLAGKLSLARPWADHFFSAGLRRILTLCREIWA